MTTFHPAHRLVVRMPALILLLVLAPGLPPAAEGSQQSVGAQQPSSRPNILFVYADDHADHAISAYGSKINQTPHIDRLATEGMVFRNSFVANSICVPARATILTGKHSHLNGALNIGDRLDQSQVTFPKLLQKEGYQTAVIGKWHLRDDPVGFDYFNVLIGQGPYYNPPMIDNGERREHVGYTTDIITDLTLDWLRNERDEDKPFMLMYQHKAPHRNWEPGPDHLDTFDDETIPEPETLFDDWSTRTSPAHLQEMTVADHMSELDLMLRPPGNLTPEQLRAWREAFDDENEAFRQENLTGREREKWHYQRYIKNYLRCVQSIDDNLGRVLEYLDESGLADNTIVIYSSDQGFYLGEHGWYDKRFMYEESLRTPLLVRWPGVIEAGSEAEEMVQNLDMAQTFLEMAGIEAPEVTEQMQGQSLVPLMKGQQPEDWRDAIYYHYYDFPAVHMVRKHYGVRNDRYKLIRYYDLPEADGGGAWELFDLQNDPNEVKNVYDDPEYADVVEQMKQRMAQLQEQYGDTDPERPNAEVYREAYQRIVGDIEPQRVVDLPRRPEEGHEPRELDQVDPAIKPLVVGARITPGAGDGVVISQGGDREGYSLYLKEGLPHFAIRSEGTVHWIAGEERVPMDEATHVAGILDADNKLSLLVNGRVVGTGNGQFITRRPHDPLIIGNDLISAVGDYDTPMPFEGEIRDIRIYVGVPAHQELKEWAGGTAE